MYFIITNQHKTATSHTSRNTHTHRPKHRLPHFDITDWRCVKDSHSRETSHCSSTKVKEETDGQGHEIVHKGSDGENKGELFILYTAICRDTHKKYSVYEKPAPCIFDAKFDEPEKTDLIPPSHWLKWRWNTGSWSSCPPSAQRRVKPSQTTRQQNTNIPPNRWQMWGISAPTSLSTGPSWSHTHTHKFELKNGCTLNYMDKHWHSSFC